MRKAFYTLLGVLVVIAIFIVKINPREGNKIRPQEIEQTVQTTFASFNLLNNWGVWFSGIRQFELGLDKEMWNLNKDLFDIINFNLMKEVSNVIGNWGIFK